MKEYLEFMSPLNNCLNILLVSVRNGGLKFVTFVNEENPMSDECVSEMKYFFFEDTLFLFSTF